MTRAGRAPLLVPAPHGWAGRAAVRGLRVRAVEGALVVEHPDGRTERRAEPGEVTRVVLVPDPQDVGLPRASYAAGLVPADTYGLLVALAGDRPVLALRLAEWVPAPAPVDGVTVRTVSGANALAGALGCAVEPADVAALAPKVRELRAVLLSPAPRLSVAAKTLLALGATALAVWFVASAIGRARGEPRAEVFGWYGALGALLLTGTWLVLRARATKPLPPPPGTAVTAGGATLHVSPDWLVLSDAAGREAWLPGPAYGGVTQAAVTTEAVVLDDANGNGLAALPSTAWDVDRLRSVLDDAGVTVRDEPSNRAPGAWLSAPALLALDDAAYGDLREPRGVPGMAALAGGTLGAAVALSGLANGEAVTIGGGALAALGAAAGWLKK